VLNAWYDAADHPRKEAPTKVQKMRAPPPITFIDLFCGCGGFSLGLRNAGWRELAAIDFDSAAIETFNTNVHDVPHVLLRDLTQFPPSELDALLSASERFSESPRVDVIVGGPPCQGFSHARRVDGANHGKSLVRDSRRYLYREYFKYVAYFQPRAFIMENVLGIKSAAGGRFLLEVQNQARRLGYRVHAEVVATWEFGVPQKRARQLIIGTRRELPVFSLSSFIPPEFKKAGRTTLWDAIGDLPALAAGTGENVCNRDRRKLQKALQCDRARWYLNHVAQVNDKPIRNHVARPHSERDLRDFARLKEGESSAVAMRDRGVKFEWPYSKEHFKDRYTRQHRNRLCSTIVAHLGKDGLMFIHPTQRRSLTPREAARVQSFPDWFQFPKARTHAFRLIGNAFPPLAARAVGAAVRAYFTEAATLRETFKPRHSQPLTAKEAVKLILPLVQAASAGTLRRMESDQFKRGWIATAFLCFELHPDGATTAGKRILKPSSSLRNLERVAPDLSKPTFAQSGWPVALAPIAVEARRRLVEGFFSPADYYCPEAHMAGAVMLEESEA
jgi:DNA (cytosine-5)-methyltransferase 1